MLDTEGSEDPKATSLDILRIQDLEVGGSVHGECGKWSVFRYEKEFLILFSSGTQVQIELPDVKSVVDYLSLD